MTERRFGDIGSKLLYENHKVRIWELRLAPGERSALHRHTLDHLLIQLEGDRIAVEPEPDTQGEFKDYLAADVVPGAAIFVNRGGVETAVNVGREPYRELIVELKE
jgi:hypothetical protein